MVNAGEALTQLRRFLGSSRRYLVASLAVSVTGGAAVAVAVVLVPSMAIPLATTVLLLSVLVALGVLRVAIRAEAASLRAQVSLEAAHGAAPLAWSEYALPAPELLTILHEIEERVAPQVVECGSGVSTLFIARALKSRGEGRLVSIEEDPAWASRLAGLLDREGLNDVVRIVAPPLVEQSCLGRTIRWYDMTHRDLPAGDPIDILIVDGPTGTSSPLARLGAVPALWSALADDAVVFLDDVHRADEKAVARLWCREFPLRVGVLAGLPRLLRFERFSRDEGGGARAIPPAKARDHD